MSLVCYGSSDSEEESDEHNANPDSKDQSALSFEDKRNSDFEEDEICKAKEKNVLNFDSIPKPVPKKGRETVKITIPSLDQFKDEEMKIESNAKPQFKSGSGLLNMLPPPKHSGFSTQRGFTPHILTKQKNTNKKLPVIKSEAKKSLTTQNLETSSIVEAEHSSENICNEKCADEENDDSTLTDYFSLEHANNKIDIKESGVLDIQLPSKSLLFSSLPEPAQSTSHSATPFYQEDTFSTAIPGPSTVQSENYSDAYAWNENYQNMQSTDQTSWSENYQNVQNVNQVDTEMQFLKDEKFKKMLGRNKEDIKIIDVNADDQLVGKEQWLMQSLTEEKTHRPLKRKGEMPTQQQKRKHQITYLAFQAKERELDLKNQWSLNSRTRRETQAKYGF